MSGKAEDDFNEPFTLISSTVDSLGSGGQSLSSMATGKGFVGFVKASRDWVASKHAGVQPWADFLNIRNISRPANVGAGTSRILANLLRFQSNYLFVFLGLVIYCVISNPTLLFALGFCLAAWWFIAIKNSSENIKLLGRDTSAKELWAGVVIISIPLFYFAGAGSTVFWIIGASVVVVLLHAVAMSTPTPQQTVDEELGIVMEDVTAS